MHGKSYQDVGRLCPRSTGASKTKEAGISCTDPGILPEKIIEDANAATTSGPDQIEQGKKQKQIFPDCEASNIGGWGYFMIERGEDLLPHSAGNPHNSIDLYLYKEGE
jgi:hypothetical protein